MPYKTFKTLEQPRDENLLRMARKQVEFIKSLYSYIAVNAFLWGIRWFTDGRKGYIGLIKVMWYKCPPG